MSEKLGPVLYIPHGGGPLPLLGDTNHTNLITFLTTITTLWKKPSAILVISAHWETELVTITSRQSPPLIYDYSGFPDASYAIQYPASGDPVLAQKVFTMLQQKGIAARLDDQRGFDHGLFVPLKLMYPEATIPCVQISLVNSLDPAVHIQIGQALAELRTENILILGSGFSFHNMGAFFRQTKDGTDPQNESFKAWLDQTCTDPRLTEKNRKARLVEWGKAPAARYCHPREEHLLPLHICYGFANSKATRVFDAPILGKMSSAYLWR